MTIAPPGPTWNFTSAHKNAYKTPAESTNPAFGSTWAPASTYNMTNKHGIHAKHENHIQTTEISTFCTLQAAPPGACQTPLGPLLDLLWTLHPPSLPPGACQSQLEPSQSVLSRSLLQPWHAKTNQLPARCLSGAITAIYRRRKTSKLLIFATGVRHKAPEARANAKARRKTRRPIKPSLLKTRLQIVINFRATPTPLASGL